MWESVANGIKRLWLRLLGKPAVAEQTLSAGVLILLLGGPMLAAHPVMAQEAPISAVQQSASTTMTASLSQALPQTGNVAVFTASDKVVTEAVETFRFRSAAEQKRAIALSRQLRCPQCQNQNLIESNSPVAKDLRLKVYQMVNEGQSDEAVIGFMTSRFGEFVRYKPALTPQTYLLWGGPFLLLAAFGGIIMTTIRRR